MNHFFHIEILVGPVIYVIQFSSDVLQMLVQELQDLFLEMKQFWLWCDKQFQIIIAAKDTAAYGRH